MHIGIKTLLLLAGICALAAQPALAEPAPATARVSIGTVHQPLYGVAFDGARGLAVGAGGRVLASADGGQTWNAETSPTTAGLLGVALRGKHGLAVGQAGLVLARGAEGDWRTIKVDTTERLMGLAMNSSGLAVAVGSFGTILRSPDFGETWSKTAPNWAAMFADHVDTLGPAFAPHLYGVSVSERGEILVVGELSLIVASSGVGGDWKVVNRGGISNGQADPSLFGIHVGEDGTGYAVGQAGRVFKTGDHGSSWTRLDAGTEAILLAVETGPSGRVLVTGIRDVRTSSDGGQHWQPVPSADVGNDWYVATAQAGSGGDVIAVGSSGKILKIPQ